MPARPNVNRYLERAFVEDANAISIGRGRAPPCHVSRLYEHLVYTIITSTIITKRGDAVCKERPS